MNYLEMKKKALLNNVNKDKITFLNALHLTTNKRIIITFSYNNYTDAFRVIWKEKTSSEERIGQLLSGGWAWNDSTRPIFQVYVNGKLDTAYMKNALTFYNKLVFDGVKSNQKYNYYFYKNNNNVVLNIDDTVSYTSSMPLRGGNFEYDIRLATDIFYQLTQERNGKIILNYVAAKKGSEYGIYDTVAGQFTAVSDAVEWVD